MEVQGQVRVQALGCCRGSLLQLLVRRPVLGGCGLQPWTCVHMASLVCVGVVAWCCGQYRRFVRVGAAGRAPSWRLGQ